MHRWNYICISWLVEYNLQQTIEYYATQRVNTISHCGDISNVLKFVLKMKIYSKLYIMISTFCYNKNMSIYDNPKSHFTLASELNRQQVVIVSGRDAELATSQY